MTKDITFVINIWYLEPILNGQVGREVGEYIFYTFFATQSRHVYYYCHWYCHSYCHWHCHSYCKLSLAEFLRPRIQI